MVTLQSRGEWMVLAAGMALAARKSVASIARSDVEDFIHDAAAGKTAGREKTKPRGLSIVRGSSGVAGRTVALLGAIFTYAVRQGLRTDNPIHGVVKLLRADDSDG